MEGLLLQEVAVSSDKGAAIPPLTRELLPSVPWFVRCFGSVNNRWNESVADAILVTRDRSIVMKAWKPVLADPDLVQRILNTIGDEMPWKYPHFIPQDECLIVFKLWWHGGVDNLERECCMLALQKVCEKDLPLSLLVTRPEITLGEFLVA